MEFSSASVIINLQTWVLLLDYLGIGIPTPPPSPSPSSHLTLLDEEDEEDEYEEEEESKQQQLNRKQQEKLQGEQQQMDHKQQHKSSQQQQESKQQQSSKQQQKSQRPLEVPSLDPDGDQLSQVGDQGGCEGVTVWGVESKGSIDISLKVGSLTVTFNKPEHPLAQGVVSELVARVESRRGNLQLSGRLGQASVVDLTETGAYYRERCVSVCVSVCVCVCAFVHVGEVLCVCAYTCTRVYSICHSVFYNVFQHNIHIHTCLLPLMLYTYVHTYMQVHHDRRSSTDV